MRSFEFSLGVAVFLPTLFAIPALDSLLRNAFLHSLFLSFFCCFAGAVISSTTAEQASASTSNAHPTAPRFEL
jgi:hypothetical protein